MEQPPPPPPPVAPPSPYAGEQALRPAPEFSFANAFAEGWESLKRNYGVLLLVIVVYIGITFALNVVVGLLQEIHPAAGLLNILTTLLVSTPLWAGGIWVGIKAWRGGLSINDLFQGFSDGARYAKVVVIGLLFYLATFAVMIPFMIIVIFGAFMVVPPAGGGGAGGAGAGGPGALMLVPLVLLLIVVFLATLFVMVRFMFAVALPLDPYIPEMGIIETLKTSWRMTAELKWLTFLAIYIISGLIAVLSFMACIFPGIFFGAPFLVAVVGASYVMLASDIGIGPQPRVRRCLNCRYDLSGLTATECPECGQRITDMP